MGTVQRQALTVMDLKGTSRQHHYISDSRYILLLYALLSPNDRTLNGRRKTNSVLQKHQCRLASFHEMQPTPKEVLAVRMIAENVNSAGAHEREKNENALTIAEKSGFNSQRRPP